MIISKCSALLLFLLLCTCVRAQDGANSALDRLTPNNVTFVLVDYLDGFMPGIRSIDPPIFIANARAFARTATIFEIPTLILGDEGGFRGSFMAEIIDEAPQNAVRVPRHTVSAWGNPEFGSELEKAGRKKIVIGGISIDNCTSLTSFDLLRNGYEVYVVVDASGTTSKLVEDVAIDRLIQAGAVPISMVQLASELLVDWETPEGPKVGKLYAELSYWGVLGFYQPGERE